MHLYWTGTGAPTVVLEAGLGDDLLYWQMQEWLADSSVPEQVRALPYGAWTQARARKMYDDCSVTYSFLSASMGSTRSVRRAGT